MPWHLRPVKGVHRPSKPRFSFGRWITVAIFTLMMVFLYATIGEERRSVQSPNPVPEVTPSSEQVKITPVLSIPAATETTIASESTPKVRPDAEHSPLNSNPDKCDGRRLYIYDMPTEFNKQLAEDCANWTTWPNMCDHMTNFGFGAPLQTPESDSMASVLQPPDAWFQTDQFTLEISFHERLKIHPCLTTNPSEASLFYTPFYPALDLTRNLHNEDLAVRDYLTKKFLAWLQSQPPYQRHGGRRHVLVLGRIVWDFIRAAGKDATWGSNLLTQPELGNVTKLLIERSPWDPTTLAIPYPTAFHPSSEADLLAWQQTLRASKRHHLASVAGGTRSKKLTGSIRDQVFDQCANSPKCNQIICALDLCTVHGPKTIMRMGLESIFCLQPPGDSPTRKGIFDSFQAGCIPVFFNDFQAKYQYLLHLPGDGSEYSVMIPEHNVTVHHYDAIEHLSQISQEEIARLQANIVNLIPKLLYRQGKLTGEYSSRDAFDVTIDGLLARFEAADASGERPSSTTTSS